MRLFLYDIIVHCLLPFTLFKLIYRGLKNPGYLNHWNERFAIYAQKDKKIWATRTTIWLHCVSVGETKSIYLLLNHLINKYPKINFLISHGTPTGRDVIFPNSSRIHRCYLPYDTSFAIKRFINFYKPKLGLIIEKELWPNLINQCNLNKLPAILINGRLSNKSLKKYLLFKDIFNNLLVQLNSIYVQNEHDRLNFKKITQAKINTMGNLKFDVRPPSNIYAQIKELKSQLKIKKQYVIVAGSTRNGEEKIILNFILKLKLKNFVLIIVPRHPERFDEVAKIFKSQNILYSRRSEYQDIQKSPQFIIGDSMGELYQYYGLANLAIIGGSILDYGGQNLIEPLSMNVPTAIGPSIYNFKNITEAAEKEKAIIRFKKINDLRDIINDLLISKIYANKLIKNTKTFMLQSRGGTEEVIKIINRYF